MGLERYPAAQGNIPDKFIDPAADVTMTPKDQVVRVDASAAAVTVTLPKVAEAKGMLYAILVRDATNDVTIADQDDSEAWKGDIVLSDVNDSVLAYSDGITWHIIQSEGGVAYGGGGVMVTKTTLTNAQIKALVATQIELVPAPGANKVIVFEGALLRLNAGSEVLTESDDDLQIKYTDDSGVSVSGAIEATDFIDQAADTYTNAVPTSDAIVAATGNVNQALVLDNDGDGEYAGNASLDATLDVWVFFRILDVS